MRKTPDSQLVSDIERIFKETCGRRETSSTLIWLPKAKENKNVKFFVPYKDGIITLISRDDFGKSFDIEKVSIGDQSWEGMELAFEEKGGGFIDPYARCAYSIENLYDHLVYSIFI